MAPNELNTACQPYVADNPTPIPPIIPKVKYKIKEIEKEKLELLEM